MLSEFYNLAEEILRKKQENIRIIVNYRFKHIYVIKDELYKETIDQLKSFGFYFSKEPEANGFHQLLQPSIPKTKYYGEVSNIVKELVKHYIKN